MACVRQAAFGVQGSGARTPLVQFPDPPGEVGVGAVDVALGDDRRDGQDEPHALFVAGLSEIGGVEGGLLPADVRRVRDALIEFPIG